MNPTILIRSVAATLAATTLLVAQSAPQPRTAARSAAPANERMQVRLAEVIAMLEEDDLTPEQRAEAKKKLEEIRARLRAASATTPTPPVAPAPAAPRVAGVAPAAPVAPVEAVDVFEAKTTPLPRRAPAAVAPTAPEAQEPPPPPPAPSAPKSPKAPKAPKAPKGEVLELADITEGKPVEVLRLGEHDVIVKHKTEGGDVVFVKPPQGAEGQAPRAYTLKTAEGEWDLQVRDEKVKAEEGQRRVRVLRDLKTEEPMVLELHGAKVQLDGAKARLEGAKLQLDGARERLEASVRADQVEQRARQDAAKVEAKAAEELMKRARVRYTETKERAEADAERVRTYTVRERAADAARAEVRARAAQGKAKEAAGFDDFQPVRGRMLGTKADDGGDGDAEIRALIEEMRAEMREIRKLIEQLRKQSVSAAKRPAEGGLFGRFVPGEAMQKFARGFAQEGDEAVAGQAGTAPRSSYRSNNVRVRKGSSAGGGTGGGIGGSAGGSAGQGASFGSGQSSGATNVFHLAPGSYSVSTRDAQGGLQRFTGSSDVK